MAYEKGSRPEGGFKRRGPARSPLRQDMNLTLTKKGKQAVEQTLGTSVSKATVADVIKATRKNGKLLRQQVEKTLGISINSYELISH